MAPFQLVLPLSLEGLVPNDDSVRLLSHELEELDYSLLYQAYSAKGRNPAVDPKTMFKILAYAYSQNIYSSTKIETACRRDINFTIQYWHEYLQRLFIYRENIYSQETVYVPPYIMRPYPLWVTEITEVPEDGSGKLDGHVALWYGLKAIYEKN